MKLFRIGFYIGLIGLMAVACSTPRTATVTPDDLEPAAISVDSLINLVPDYQNDLQTIMGTGRALVSEPGNSERVTLEFQSNRTASLIEIRTGAGVQGGQILVDGDSLLIYNRVDRYAEKASITQSDMTSVGSLASLNMLDLFNFTLEAGEIDEVFESRDSYIVLLGNEARVTVSKENGLIKEVEQSPEAQNGAYRKITYEGYATIEGFQLPRKITILSRDGESRVTFLVQRLEVNKTLPELKIDLPDNIPVYRQ